MKKVIVILLIILCSCNKEETLEGVCYKGKLVIKGICTNYVVQLTEGAIDSLLIERTWKNPLTDSIYKNVFAIANFCDPIPNLKEGDSFYFTITTKNESCVKCLAYSPVPEKTIFIKICN